ncbi:MAG: hypothetical protein PHW69_04735 [Elusimicrobiaceae bacterium]|nr:hypothetical protein [Elusimicrobiaceae bacterium]
MTPVIRLCTRCGRPHDYETDRSSLCQSCRMADAENAAISGKQSEHNRVDETEHASILQTRFGLALKLAALLACFGLLAWNIVEFRSTLKPGRPLRWGSYNTDRETEKCVTNLWKALSAFQQGDRAVYVCPATGAPYQLINTAEGPVLECPNPHKHKLRRLRAGGKLVMPQAAK